MSDFFLIYKIVSQLFLAFVQNSFSWHAKSFDKIRIHIYIVEIQRISIRIPWLSRLLTGAPVAPVFDKLCRRRQAFVVLLSFIFSLQYLPIIKAKTKVIGFAC